MIHQGLVVCICTYRRVNLLKILLDDIVDQTMRPNLIVIVDGDPISGEVKRMLLNIASADTINFIYVPSNHANLSYQRYLGWLVTKEMNISYFLYLDDDLRLVDNNAIYKVIEPLTWNHRKIIGVTSETNEGDSSKYLSEQILVDRRNESGKNSSFLVRHFGASKNIEAGGLSPSGHRKKPVQGRDGLSEVKWLQGRVMAYSFRALGQDCFSEDLFAITAINCGLGEDTFLSTKVGINGKMLFIYNAGFEHPNDTLPNSYPIRAFKLGYATAYSRRFLNDNYRVTRSPQIIDRLALIRSYFGNNLINFGRAFTHPRWFRFEYAFGYFVGSLRGLLQMPTAKNLTPDIDWWADAKLAIANQIRIK